MYHPKSQIQTNLYTNGGEYVIKNTDQDYIGFYYKLSNGHLYIGKEPQGRERIELVIPKDVPSTAEDYNDNKIRVALFNSDPDPVLNVDEDLFNGIAIVEYADLLERNQVNLETRSIPSSYYAQPTKEEEEIGEYRRYFAKKTNELIYIEISKDTYIKFKSKDPTVAFDLYECLNLPWSLIDGTGEVNKNIVSLIERNNKWDGFSLYFKDNFVDARSTKRSNQISNKSFSPSTSTNFQSTPTGMSSPSTSTPSTPSGGGGGGY